MDAVFLFPGAHSEHLIRAADRRAPGVSSALYGQFSMLQFGQCVGESGAGDVELLIDVCKVGVDRLVGDEQQLSDLGVAVSARGELGNPQLAGREGLDASESRAARLGAGRAELVKRMLAEQL